MLVEDVIIAETTALIFFRTLHVARSIGAQYLPEFMYKVNHELVCSYSVPHFLELCLLIAGGIRRSHFSLCHSVQSYFYDRTVLSKKHAAAQRTFVSVCFLFLLFWGTPNRWAYAMLMYRPHFTV